MNDKNNYKELQLTNQKQEKYLSGEYRIFYNKLKSDLYKDVQRGEELEIVLNDIMDIITEAMNDNRAIKEVIPTEYEEFYNELLQSLPQYTKEAKEANQRRKNIALYSVIAVLSCSIIIIYLIGSGIFGVLFEGISYVAGSLDKYSANFTLLDESYSVDINLDDLDSNQGKVIFDDGIHKIYIDSIDNSDGKLEYGGYRIHFRSSGKYSLDGATLVSGIKHYATETQWYSYDMTAKMTTEYNGKSYDGGVMGLTGLNYKDGDAFGFYLFSNEAYEEDGVTLNEKGIAKIILTNLCKNTWVKK